MREARLCVGVCVCKLYYMTLYVNMSMYIYECLYWEVVE